MTKKVHDAWQKLIDAILEVSDKASDESIGNFNRHAKIINESAVEFIDFFDVKKRQDGRQRRARQMHNSFCTLEHEDQSGWYYEEEFWDRWKRGYKCVWEAPTHKSWLKKAQK